jgi:hypothetical protein
MAGSAGIDVGTVRKNIIVDEAMQWYVSSYV